MIKEDEIKESWAELGITASQSTCDNDGWIILESVDDLPKTVGFYWAEDKEGNIGQVHFEDLTTAKYVAYQSIVKPKERLY